MGGVGVVEIDARVALQWVEIGEVADMAQSHYGYIDFAFHGMALLALKADAVFRVDVQVGQVGDDAEHGYLAYIFQHLAAFGEKAQVAAKLVDDDALDELPVFFRLQGYTTIDGSEDASAVYIAYQYHVGIGVACHGEVDEVGGPQVEFADAACTLHHDGVVAGGETVEGLAYFLAKVDATCLLPSPVVVCVFIAQRFAIEHHLAGVVGLRLE